MRRKMGVMAVSAALGAGAAIGVAACGEDRPGVDVEGATTGATGGSTTPSGTTGTATTTSPSTETSKTTTGTETGSP